MEESSTRMVDDKAVNPKVWVDKLLASTKAGNVQRWHTLKTLQSQNVGHHTYGVWHMVYTITMGKASPNLLAHAMFHDVAEAETGDIPHPIKKRFPDEYYKVEGAVLDELGMLDHLPPLEPDELNNLKVADLLEMGMFASAELHLGNRGGAEIMVNVLRALNGMEMPSMAGLIAESFEETLKKRSSELASK